MATALTSAPIADPAAIERLSVELRASPTATAVLERRCVALGLADPPRVHALVDRGQVLAGQVTAVARRLAVGPDEPIGVRHVRLMCGPHLLSQASNWYVLARLPDAMIAALDDGDAPFGRVIMPLAPHRRTYWTRRIAAADAPRDGVVLRHRAVVFDGDDRPLAVVAERYQRILVDGIA